MGVIQRLSSVRHDVMCKTSIQCSFCSPFSFLNSPSGTVWVKLNEILMFLCPEGSFSNVYYIVSDREHQEGEKGEVLRSVFRQQLHIQSSKEYQRDTVVTAI